MLKRLHTWVNGKPLPPGPDSWWQVMREMKQWQNPYEFKLTYQRYLMHQYGDIYTLPGFRGDIIVCNPIAVQHILKKHPERYSRQHRSWKSLSRFFGESLLTTDNDALWQQGHDTIKLAFQGKFLTKYLNNMQPIVQQYAQKLEQAADKKHPIVLYSFFSQLSLTLVSSALFGYIPCLKQAAKLSKSSIICENTITNGHPYLPSLSSLKYHWHKKQIEQFIHACLEQKTQQLLPMEPNDLLDILLQAETKNILPLSLKAEMMTFFHAGYKSLSATLCWAWWLLDQHPNVREKVEQELQLYPLCAPLTLKDLSKLQYTKAVLLETMRLYPPLPGISRVAKQDDEIEGFLIPKHRRIIIFNYNTHVNPKYWDNPNSFIPERFLQPSTPSHPGAYTPFGLGARACIGRVLAIYEGILVIASLSQKFRVYFKQKRLPEEQDFILRPPLKTKCYIQQR